MSNTIIMSKIIFVKPGRDEDPERRTFIFGKTMHPELKRSKGGDDGFKDVQILVVGSY